MTKYRIAILDGFRAVAILAVMFFHFFSRWTMPLNPVSLYPYNSQYDFFGFGFYGVNFFFIISGFVIFFTLDNTTYFFSFWKKRLIRLLPSMIFASLLTFLVFLIFDNTLIFSGSHEAKNFLPSVTFITPDLFNHFYDITKTNFDYIDGSYWSLWPEIQFYLFSSFLFYWNKIYFVRNYISLSFLLIIIDYLFSHITPAHTSGNHFLVSTAANYQLWFHHIFNLFRYLPFFSMGVLFYLLFKNKHLGNKKSVSTIFCSALFLCCVFVDATWPIRILYCLMYLLFLCFIYYPDKLLFFENKTLVSIGLSSYFLYLIHQHLGVLLIHKLGVYFYPFGILFTLLVFYLLILFSRIYTEKIDKPIGRSLKKIMLIKE